MSNSDFVSMAFDSADEYYRRKKTEFEKLAMNPCHKKVAVMDRVLVSGCLSGHGFEWDRIEAIVLQIAESAYKVEFDDPRKKVQGVQWVHKVAVTDVLDPNLESR